MGPVATRSARAELLADGPEGRGRPAEGPGRLQKGHGEGAVRGAWGGAWDWGGGGGDILYSII